MHLGHAAREDKAYANMAVDYFREFCYLLPDSSPNIIHNMMMAEADALISAGDLAAGEDVFRLVVKRFPEDVWSYIRWGDVYAFPFGARHVPKDAAKAERIYRMALGRGLEDEGEVLQRIDDLKDDEG